VIDTIEVGGFGLLRGILFVSRDTWRHSAIRPKYIQKRPPSGEGKPGVFKPYRVPAKQELSQQVPIPFLAGNDDEIGEKSTHQGGPQPAGQSAAEKPESTGKDYYVGDGIDRMVREQRRGELVAEDGLSTQVADRRKRVFDPGPVKSGAQFDLTMGQTFDLRQHAHVNGLLKTFPEFARVPSQLIDRGTELSIVNELRRQPNDPMSEIRPPGCRFAESRGAPDEGRC
jgi:hypothetical protein